MNYSDSDRLESYLLQTGLEKSRNENNADLVVINSCSVRQMAEDRTYGKIEKLARRKKRPRIVATGCLVSDKIWKKLLGKNKFDLCIPIDRITDLGEYLEKWKLIPIREKSTDNEYRHYLEIMPQRNKLFSAQVPIMTGCNNFCSYCAVPYTRGREVSRPKEEILNEIKQLVTNGCFELTLLGQNVNSYGNDWHSGKNKNDFVDLLKLISDIKQLKRIYFISSHPKDMSDELIRLVAEKKNICNYIHLPLQAGSDEILKVMNRKYTREDYLKLVRKIRKAIPEVTLSSDIIVGFPGESREQFEQSLEMARIAKYDMIYIGEYSSRPKTAASRMKDDVSRPEKKRRKKELNDILEKHCLERNNSYINQRMEIIFHKYVKGKLVGYTEGLKQVYTKGNKDYIGKMGLVKITKAMNWALEGKIIKII